MPGVDNARGELARGAFVEGTFFGAVLFPRLRVVNRYRFGHVTYRLPN